MDTTSIAQRLKAVRAWEAKDEALGNEFSAAVAANAYAEFKRGAEARYEALSREWESIVPRKFRAAYQRAERNGWVDAWGGVQCQRVFRQWLEAGCPEPYRFAYMDDTQDPNFGPYCRICFGFDCRRGARGADSVTALRTSTWRRLHQQNS